MSHVLRVSGGRPARRPLLRLAVLLALLASLGLPACLSPRGEPGALPRSAWTLFFVMAASGDGDVENLRDLERAAAHVGDDVTVLALVSQQGRGRLLNLEPWHGLRLVRLFPSRADILTDLSCSANEQCPTTVADPNMLAAQLGGVAAPHIRGGLVIVTRGHGFGVAGVCRDSLSKAPALWLDYEELQSALARGLASAKRTTADVIVLQNCTTGCIEAVERLHGLTRWLISCQVLTWTNAIDWAGVVQELEARPYVTDQRCAHLILDEYGLNRPAAIGCTNRGECSSLLDLGRYPELRAALHAVSAKVVTELAQGGASAAERIASAQRRATWTVCGMELESVAGAERCGCDATSDCCMRDLGALLHHLQEGAGAPLGEAAAHAGRALQGMVVRRRSHSPDDAGEAPAYSGISLFLPCHAVGWEACVASPGCTSHPLLGLVAAFREGSPHCGLQDEISVSELRAGAERDPGLGPDGLRLSATANWAGSASGRVRSLLRIRFLRGGAPTGLTHDVPQWSEWYKAGEPVRASWDGRVPHLGSGPTAVPLFLNVPRAGFAGPDGPLFATARALHAPQGLPASEARPLTLLLEAGATDGRLELLGAAAGDSGRDGLLLFPLRDGATLRPAPELEAFIRGGLASFAGAASVRLDAAARKLTYLSRRPTDRVLVQLVIQDGFGRVTQPDGDSEVLVSLNVD